MASVPQWCWELGVWASASNGNRHRSRLRLFNKVRRIVSIGTLFCDGVRV